MELLKKIVDYINIGLWDYLLLILLLGTGIYFTLRLRFVQVRKFGEGMKRTFKGVSLKGDKAGREGMSSFQSLATSVAAQIGTGNLVGTATAIVSGGAGAIFWMWLSGFFGMATIYAEATLAQKYKEIKDGEIVGGPVYYIKVIFKGRFGKILAGFFAVSIIFALGFMGNMVQANSIGDSFNKAFNIPSWVVGLVISLLAGVVFIGGVKRIAGFTEKVVPIMALLYIIGAIIAISMRYDMIPSAFKMIFVGAFNPKAVMGGVIGVTIKESMRYGVARGLFSNEAGMGSTPHAHALAKVKHPCEQGTVAIVGVFIDTFVVLTLTALVILTSGMINSDLTGAALTQSAFSASFGKFGDIFIAVCLFFFAFSTIVGWYFFGEANVKYLFGKKAVKIYAILVMAFIICGSILKVDIVWSLSDMFNGLMVLPNLIALLALSGIVSKCSREYDGESDRLRIYAKRYKGIEPPVG